MVLPPRFEIAQIHQSEAALMRASAKFGGLSIDCAGHGRVCVTANAFLGATIDLAKIF